MSNVFEENKIEKNILVLHPMGYETEIARSLDNNLNNIKVHWKNSINNFHFSTYDAFMISLDFFDEDDENTIMQFLEELYKTNKPIVLLYNSYDKIEGKAISYLKNKFKVYKKPSPKREGFLIYLEQVAGIGPATFAWEADVLPLNYTCKQCILNM